MKKLTFEEAKKLSVQKWEYIVNNNGQKKGLKNVIPGVKKMFNKCPMCAYHFIQQDGSCVDCIYDLTCNTFYQTWNKDRTKENAQVVLEQIIGSNC